jgi:hypothetical protein
MQDKTALWGLVTSVTKAELHSRLRGWLDSATKQEIKGLVAINAIWKHKGQKLFKPKPKCFLPEVSLPKRNISTYKATFVGKTNDYFVLSHRKLKDLPASQVLTPTALSVLEHWLTLKDDKYYRTLMLTCLRGMAAVCMVYAPSISESSTVYGWKTLPHQHKSPVQVSKSRSESALRPWAPRSEKLELSATVSEFKIYKANWANGNGNILAWPGGSKQGTLYQDTYTAFYNKSPTVQPARFVSSVALSRMIPYPDVLDRSR